MNWGQNIGWLTIGELRELNEAPDRERQPSQRSPDPARRPPEARRIRIFAWAVPATPYAGDRGAPFLVDRFRHRPLLVDSVLMLFPPLILVRDAADVWIIYRVAAAERSARRRAADRRQQRAADVR